MNESVIIMRIVKDCNILSPQEIVSKYRGVMQGHVLDILNNRNNYSKIHITGDPESHIYFLISDISSVLGIPVKRVLSKSQELELCIVRQMMFFISRSLKISSDEVAAKVVDRDRTTVTTGAQTFKNGIVTKNVKYLDAWNKWIAEGCETYTNWFKWLDSDIESETPVIPLTKPLSSYAKIPRAHM
jgi:hypothetical protein